MFETKKMNMDVYNASLASSYTKLESLLLSTRLSNPDEIDLIKEADSFIEPDLKYLKDALKAAERIKQAIDNNERIILVTDYDADGVSSAAIGYRGLQTLGCKKENIRVIVNERVYGNGVNQNIVDAILMGHAKDKVDLIITADHGSADDERYKVLKKKGIDVIVTDHHELQDTGAPKNVYAFVNVKRPDDTFNRNISGATVLYYVLKQINELYKNKYDIDYLLAFVGLTVISDQMSLRDPLNRFLYKKGIKIINETEAPPWSTLKRITKIRTKIDENVLNMAIVPIINSGNRMGKAVLAFKFLAEENKSESGNLLVRLNMLNIDRKKLTLELRKEAERQMNNYTRLYDNSLVIVLREGEGVIGIISSIYGETVNRPTGTFIKKDDGTFVGSFRAIVNINLIEVFDYIRSIDKTVLIKAGGHAAAAGATVASGKIRKFIELFDKGIKHIGYKEIPYAADLYINGKFITKGLHDATRSLAPYGNKWPKPIFATTGVIKDIRYFGFNNAYGSLKLDVDAQVLDLFIMSTHEAKKFSRGDNVTITFSSSLVFKNNDIKLSLTLDKIKEA
jgi:single-stranded-DNA-specific exonuclease